MLHFKDEKELVKSITGQIRGKTLLDFYRHSIHSLDGQDIVIIMNRSVGSYSSLLDEFKNLEKRGHSSTFSLDGYNFSGHYRFLFSVGDKKELYDILDILFATDEEKVELVKAYPAFLSVAYPHFVRHKKYDIAERLLDIVENSFRDNIDISINSLIANEYIPYLNRRIKLGKLNANDINDYLRAVYNRDEDITNLYKYADQQLVALPPNNVDWDYYKNLVNTQAKLFRGKSKVTSLSAKKVVLSGINPFDLVEGDTSFRKEVFSILDAEKISMIKNMNNLDPVRLKKLLVNFLNDEYSKMSKKKLFVKNYRRLVNILGDGFVDTRELVENIRGHILLEKLNF
jgi:hypothetical protein